MALVPWYAIRFVPTEDVPDDEFKMISCNEMIGVIKISQLLDSEFMAMYNGLFDEAHISPRTFADLKYLVAMDDAASPEVIH